MNQNADLLKKLTKANKELDELEAELNEIHDNNSIKDKNRSDNNAEESHNKNVLEELERVRH